MEVLFENEYTMGKELFKEYVYNVLCKKLIINGLIICILGIFWFFITKLHMILSIAIIIGVFSLIMPLLTIKSLEETSKRLNNGNIEKTNVKFSNNIIMNEGKAHLEFEYTQINQIIQTKSLIVLKISEQSAVLVLKNGFLNGNENDFIKFIEEKIK